MGNLSLIQNWKPYSCVPLYCFAHTFKSLSQDWLKIQQIENQNLKKKNIFSNSHIEPLGILNARIHFIYQQFWCCLALKLLSIVTDICWYAHSTTNICYKVSRLILRIIIYLLESFVITSIYLLYYCLTSFVFN